MKKILIAEHSSAMTVALTETLGHKYAVFICRGSCLTTAIESLCPDALIVNVTLIGIDGLRKICGTANMPPVIFIITNILTEQLILTAQEVGVNYIARIPFSLDAMAQQLDNLLDK